MEQNEEPNRLPSKSTPTKGNVTRFQSATKGECNRNSHLVMVSAVSVPLHFLHYACVFNRQILCDVKNALKWIETNIVSLN